MEHGLSFEQNQLIIEECLEAAASLESIIDSLEEAKNNDQTMDSFSAEGYYRAIESAIGQTLTMEIFEDHSSLESIHASPDIVMDDLTLEKAKGALGKLWSGVKNAGARLKQAVGDELAASFKGIKGMTEKYEKLEESLKEVEGEPKKEKITVSQGSRLHYEGSMEVKDVARGLEETNKVLNTLNEAYFKLVNASADVGEELVSEAEKVSEIEDEDERKEMLEKVSEEYNDHVIEIMEEGVKMVQSLDATPISGGRAIRVWNKVDLDGKDVKKLKKSDTEKLIPEVKDVAKFGEFDDKQEIDAPGKKDVEEVLKAVGDTLGQIKELQKSLEDNLNRALETSGKLYQLKEAAGKNKILSRVVSAFKAFAVLDYTGQLINNFRDTNAHRFKVLRAGLNYVEKTAKNLE
jgi:hypothetical protein